jgi:phosphate transport system protein
MTVILRHEMERLKRLALEVAARVETSLHDAWVAFAERDTEAAERIIRHDAEVDALEVDVEEEALKILALHQPVAVDLRLIVAVIKLNADLERIGDLAADIAERAKSLSQRPPVAIPEPLPVMAAAVERMVRQALDALVNLDPDLARGVCADDDTVDERHRQMFSVVGGLIRQQPERADDILQVLSVSRYLERIADHATNIAEDVIYLVEGDIVRHHAEGTEAPP